MDIQLYELCIADATVKSLLGNKPRIYEFGQAPSKTVLPYVTWSQITGSPDNNLSHLPDMDYCNTQIDIWAANADSMRAVRDALQAVIEPVTHITSWNGEGKDAATTNYRCTFSVDWYIAR